MHIVLITILKNYKIVFLLYSSFYEDIITSDFYIVSNNVNYKSYGIVGDKLDGYYIDLGVSSLVQGGVLSIVLELYKANRY